MSSDTKVNVVLVHGAWADGSSWQRVIPLLYNEGFRVTTVPIPLSSLEDDVARTQSVIKRVLAANAGPIVLAAHSWGGAVISAAGTDPNIVGLVYVAAFAPDEDEVLGPLNDRFPPGAGLSHIQGPDDQGFLWIDPAVYPDVFAQDLDKAGARIMAATQRPLAANVFGAKPSTAAWRSKPSWYLVAEDDQIINPDLERWMAQRMRAETHSVRSSHAAMMSHPHDVVELITHAAAASAGARIG